MMLQRSRRESRCCDCHGRGVWCREGEVEVLASHGISVVAIDRAWPGDQPGGDGVEQMTGDVVDDSTWSAAVSMAERLGRPSMLVLNAAKLVVGTVLEVTAEQFRAVMEVNVIAAVKGLQAVLPSMLSHGRGSIVAVASTNALYAEQALASYNSSKGALLQFIRSVAVDFARAGFERTRSARVRSILRSFVSTWTPPQTPKRSFAEDRPTPQWAAPRSRRRRARRSLPAERCRFGDDRGLSTRRWRANGDL